MSVIADKVHALLSRFTSVGKKDVEDIITALTDHVVPLLAEARAELVADIGQIVAEVKTDEAKLAAEIAKLLGHTPAAPVTPAPGEPPAAG